MNEDRKFQSLTIRPSTVHTSRDNLNDVNWLHVVSATIRDIAGERACESSGFSKRLTLRICEYDADGNLTRKWKSGYEQRLHWSSLGQLDSVVTNGSRVAYGYDGFGRRVRASYGNGVVKRYVHDGTTC
jgi:YD repeat-containing protein